MNKKFTLEKLIQYNYNELDSFEKLSIETALENNYQMKMQHKDLKEVQKILNSSKRKPSDTSIRIIMDYSRSSSTELV